MSARVLIVEDDAQSRMLERDIPLSVSGLLHEKFGGPSVRPYQPRDYLVALNFPRRDYSESWGEDLYRRGLYTFWQRTFLHPSIAAFDAQFALTEVRLGVIPAVISPYVLAAIGERKARRYMLTAERFSAAEAYRVGLVHEIVPGEAELDEAVGEIVDALLPNGPVALGECKSLIKAVANRPITQDVIIDTARRIARVRASAEGKEGMTAFLQKRKPNWIAKS